MPPAGRRPISTRVRCPVPPQRSRQRPDQRPRLPADRLQERLGHHDRWDPRTDRRNTCLRRLDTEWQAPPDRSSRRGCPPRARFGVTRRSLRSVGRRVSRSRNASTRVSSSPRSVKSAASRLACLQQVHGVPRADRPRSSQVFPRRPETRSTRSRARPIRCGRRRVRGRHSRRATRGCRKTGSAAARASSRAWQSG